MDFNDTKEEAAFRKEARAWLKGNVPKKKELAAPTFVSFDYEERTYQIDTTHRKVYRRFVEIETSLAAHIMTHWREQAVTA